MKKNIIISWSSGKDSTLTLERLQEDERYNVVGLYTTYVGQQVPFQVTPIDLVKLQAKRLGLPLILIELPEVFPPNEIYQSTVVEGVKNSDLPVDGVAFGDMFCNGIADYRRSYIEKAGWECIFPLLGEDSTQLANEIIERGIETRLVTVDRNVLSNKLLGSLYTKELVERLPVNVDPCGEDGEFHTLVTNSASFSESIHLFDFSTKDEQRFSHLIYRWDN
ncbi:ATPase [Vibrio maerlii]|uniref:Dph6-related ATP pyrophosphatase n=1 Tax=Vibrio maerlii TaxID=2231648 RepID=UPI000E3BAC8F|nr:ATPase [Vibrio maerlii]